jgi:pyrimidine operon attenuation protein/uracil phosphoribosyltransferase
MRFIEKACVMDAARINRALSRLASEIVEHNRGVEGLLLVGVRRRGVPLAERIAERVAELEGAPPRLATIDVAFYGDDLSLVASKPVVGESTLPVDLADATVVLVDDVLYTGRTVYAAIEHILATWRPKRVQLAVLIDRGHRELPIQADYIGKIVPTKGEEIVKVMLTEFDDAEKVLIVELEPGGPAA